MARKKQRLKKNKPFYESNSTLVNTVIISVLGLLIYSNTFAGAFLLDDLFYIKENVFLRDLSNFIDFKYWLSPQQRPIPTFTFALNYWLNDFNVWSYHFVNVFFHLATSIVVYLLTKLIFQNYLYANKKDNTKAEIVSLSVALIFVSHPVQTQTVNYIVQLMTILSAFFYLLAIYTYLKSRIYHLSGHHTRAILYYIITFFMFVFAMLSKQNAATIPLVFLLVEILFIRNKEGKIVKPYIITYVSVLFLGAIIVILGGFLPKENDIISRDIYFATQMRVIFIYIQTMFLPISLNFDPLVELSKSLFGIKEVLGFLGHISILLAGIWAYKKNRVLTFGIFWFYITLLVESSIIPIRDVIFDHRLYLPFFGFSIALVYSIYTFFLKKKSLIFIFISVFGLSLIYGAMSYNRNKIWGNKVSFWLNIAEQPPVKSRVYRYLAMAYTKQRKFDLALGALNKADTIQPNIWEVNNNRAIIYAFRNNNRAAIKEYSRCIELDPTNDLFYIDRSELYIKINEFEKAKEDLSRAIEINPKNERSYIVLGRYYLDINEYENSIESFNKAIKLNSNNIEIYNNRGVANMRLKRIDNSIEDFSKIISIDKSNYLAYKNRGDCYLFKKEFRNAIYDFSFLIRVNGRDKKALYGRGISYLNLKEYDYAYRDLKKSELLGQKIDPNLLREVEQMINQNKK